MTIPRVFSLKIGVEPSKIILSPTWCSRLRPTTNLAICRDEFRRPLSDVTIDQLSQTYAQAAKPSTISTTTQTDLNITDIICTPLQCLKPLSSEKQMSSTSSLIPVASTSSSLTQVQLFPSASPIVPCESQPHILLPTIVYIPRFQFYQLKNAFTTSDEFSTLSTEILATCPYA
ncbi:hypothetical protein TNCV_1696681 [Trichonephila clavipes]|nr:hypothetical protein TNCV_1696681 [Trichonephila clavipes]